MMIFFLVIELLIFLNSSYAVFSDEDTASVENHDIYNQLHYLFKLNTTLFSNIIIPDHVTVSFARSGGPGGQNVNKGLFFVFNKLNLCMIPLLTSYWSLYPLLVTVNTKVDMRFNVKNAYWLSDRIKEKIMQMVCYFHLFPYFIQIFNSRNLLRRESCYLPFYRAIALSSGNI